MVDVPGCTGHQSERRAGLRVQRIQPAADARHRHHALGPRRLEADDAGLDLHPGLRVPWPVCWLRRQVAGPRRTAQERRGGRLLLGRRISDRGARRQMASHRTALPGLRRARRMRTRARFHHAHLRVDSLVPRSPRDGDRPRHHGLWWWGADCGPGVAHPDGALRLGDFGRRRGDARRPRPRLHDADVDGRFHVPASPSRMASERVGTVRRRRPPGLRGSFTSTRRSAPRSSICCGRCCS